MAYNKTTWNNGQPPAINASNLNKLETQYEQAKADLDAKMNETTGHRHTGAVGDAPKIALADTTGTINDTQHGNRSGGSLHALVTTLVHGFMASTDKSKLNNIEAGATADQTANEILNALKTVDGAGSGLDADLVRGIAPVQIAHGTLTDTTTVMLAETKYTKTIPLGFNAKRGRLIAYTNEGSVVYFDTNYLNAISHSIASPSGTDSDYRSRNVVIYTTTGVWSSNNDSIYLEDVYISGSNLIMIFDNPLTLSRTLMINNLKWEVEG